jgi:hypothetical protein
VDLGDVKALWYITHFNNVQSIMQRGILCHNAALELDPTRIDDTDVNKRRDRRITHNRTLHDYANLYFHPRNGMMFRKVYGDNVNRVDLVLIKVSKEIFQIEDVLMSDMNAAKDGALIRPWKVILPKLETAQIFAKYWNDPDETVRKQKMARMMAEVLVPDCVATKFITGVTVASYQAEDRAKQYGLPSVKINPDAFFATSPGAKFPWHE